MIQYIVLPLFLILNLLQRPRLFATLLWFIGEAIDHSDVFERDFRLDDPLISHPHTKQQQVQVITCVNVSSLINYYIL